VGAERAADLLTPPFVRGHDHALGDGGPELVLFGDYQDPDSAAAHRGVEALRERWDGFTYAWRHLPIGERRPQANGAALAAEGAAAQDAFWAYHHVLLANQDALSVPDLLNYAGGIGLDVALLMNDMLEGRHAEAVLDDVRSAVDSGAGDTPALFVGGVRWDGGWEPDALEGALRAAMAG
jgi:protein-disulfide isomerase